MYIFKCILCRQRSHAASQICNDCYQSLPWHVGCGRCGNSILVTATGTHCKHCLLEPPPYQQLISAWQYAFPLSQIISQFKFSDQIHWQKFLSQGLIRQLQQRPDFILPDRIIPMPLHLKRLRQRGYNQANLIAKSIAKHLSIKLNTNLCSRQKYTQPQVELPEKNRRANVRNAFHVAQSLKNLKIAIVDDVITTGSTAASLSQALLGAGAEHIQVWCLTKTSSSTPTKN